MPRAHCAVIALLFLLVETCIAQFATNVCLFNGGTRIVRAPTRKCPCYLAVSIKVPQPAVNLKVVVYAVLAKDYEAFAQSVQEAVAVGATIPDPPRSAIRLLQRDFTRFEERLRSYGWFSGTQNIGVASQYVAVTILQASAFAPCAFVRFDLEAQPPRCPLRLAPRSSTPATRSSTTYVVGGTQISDENDEFTAYNALISTNQGNCTASVVASDWLLTAAHCQVRKGSRVLVGGTDLSGGATHAVARAVSHPGFIGGVRGNAAIIVNDVAVVKLDRPIKSARPIALNSNARGPQPGTIVRATGYGKVTTATVSSYLHLVDVAVLSSGECRRRFQSIDQYSIARGINSRVHVCTGRDSDCVAGGVCFGDSGGPIVARTVGGALVQIGVTSYGDVECGTRGSADVFARVSEYLPWIQRTTGNAVVEASWESISNNGNGNYGDDRTFPVWAIVLSTLGALVVIAIAFAIYALKTNNPPANQSDECPSPVFISGQSGRLSAVSSGAPLGSRPVQPQGIAVEPSAPAQVYVPPPSAPPPEQSPNGPQDAPSVEQSQPLSGESLDPSLPELPQEVSSEPVDAETFARPRVSSMIRANPPPPPPSSPIQFSQPPPPRLPKFAASHMWERWRVRGE